MSTGREVVNPHPESATHYDCSVLSNTQNRTAETQSPERDRAGRRDFTDMDDID